MGFHFEPLDGDARAASPLTEVTLADGWSRKFSEPIELPNGETLVTLQDAIAWLAKSVPASEHNVLAQLWHRFHKQYPAKLPYVQQVRARHERSPPLQTSLPPRPSTKLLQGGLGIFTSRHRLDSTDRNPPVASQLGEIKAIADLHVGNLGRLSNLVQN